MASRLYIETWNLPTYGWIQTSRLRSLDLRSRQQSLCGRYMEFWGPLIGALRGWVFVLRTESETWLTLMYAIRFSKRPSFLEGCFNEFCSFVECCLHKDSGKRWTICLPIFVSINIEQVLNYPSHWYAH